MEKVQKKNMKESIDFQHPAAPFFLFTLYVNFLQDNFSDIRNLSGMTNNFEKIVINQIKGANLLNLVTFQSQSGNAEDVILSYTASSSADNYVLKFNGADFVQFKNITLQANGSSYAKVVSLESSCSSFFTSGGRSPSTGGAWMPLRQ